MDGPEKSRSVCAITMGRARACVLLCAFLFSLTSLQTPALASKKSYVVFLGGLSHGLNLGLAPQSRHYQLLASILGDVAKAQEAIFYSYTRMCDGFAAYLEESDAALLSELPGVLSVMPNTGYKLHTTRSWEFLGLENNGQVPVESMWYHSGFGENTIIGNLDTGVWPESASFKDDGMGPIPGRWHGICQNDFDNNFSCNNKLIGARYFNKGYLAFTNLLGSPNATSPELNTPRDLDGHGTHTLSTAGGAFSPQAGVFGYGEGTAKGGSPRARVAAYKVCWPAVDGGGCFSADIFAAFDAAIADGVDVLSLSLGGPPTDYFNDPTALGAFYAVQNGIAVVCSAGNSGPQPGSVTNVAPWIFTVGASTMDRDFPAYVSFGNWSLKGQSLSDTSLAGSQQYPMISAQDANAANRSTDDSKLCMLGSLDREKVAGKIVVCLRGVTPRVEKGEAVREAGGVGMVLANDAQTGGEILADAHVLPATHISYSDGRVLFSYLQSTGNPRGYITNPSTQLGTKPAPVMASFSSRGPNIVTPQILKPDITAPGISVIAAFSGAVAPTGLAFDHRRVAYNAESGTSMSCPHVSGIVGLFKTQRPDWSPAAIKSAIMTSASTVDNTGKPILSLSGAAAKPFSYGAGHVQPNQAMDPGLVYNTTLTDYLHFLCALGPTANLVALFNGGEPFLCPVLDALKAEDLNYPSITLPRLSGSATVRRRVQNVGSPSCTYKASVAAPPGVRVTVAPSELSFGYLGEEKEFEVTVQAVDGGAPAAGGAFGSIVWSDGKHSVASPLVLGG